MSIVEKALAKAQKAPAAEPPRKVDSPASPPLADVAPEPLELRVAVTPEPQRAPEPVVPEPGPVHAGRIAGNVHVDSGRLTQLGMLPPADLVPRALDEFRRIKWPLLAAAIGRGGPKTAENNLILVTSAMAEEGKSFVSMNLAGAIARERDCRVILVDGDLRSPRLSEAVGLEARPGLHDVLLDTSLSIEDAIYETDIWGLRIVPAGTASEHGPELLASRRMGQICDTLSRIVPDGVVIFDSPPLLATNEAQVLSRHVGQVLLVVRADFTEQRFVREALALVDRSKQVSCMLNSVERTGLGDYSSASDYGYGYGREGGGRSKAPSR